MLCFRLLPLRVVVIFELNHSFCLSTTATALTE
jgi:hypothetical protein